MNTRIAVGGSSAYPPTLAHLQLLQLLLDCSRFDTVVWIISGERTDKHYNIDPAHRQNMTEILLQDLRPTATNLRVIYEVNHQNTPSFVWLKRLELEYEPCEITWFTGSDCVLEIERSWHKGLEFVSRYPILVVHRHGFSLPPNNHPSLSNFKQIIRFGPLPLDTSSTEIRSAIQQGKPWKNLTTPAIAEYIVQNQLFK